MQTYTHITYASNKNKRIWVRTGFKSRKKDIMKVTKRSQTQIRGLLHIHKMKINGKWDFLNKKTKKMFEKLLSCWYTLACTCRFSLPTEFNSYIELHWASYGCTCACVLSLYNFLRIICTCRHHKGISTLILRCSVQLCIYIIIIKWNIKLCVHTYFVTKSTHIPTLLSPLYTYIYTHIYRHTIVYTLKLFLENMCRNLYIIQSFV